MVDQLHPPQGLSRSASAIRLATFREIFAVDLRTLALFRVLLGVYIILDLIFRARDLTAHYTDFGIMPRSDAVDFLSDSSFSIHLINGSALFQALLFLIAGLFALMLLVGWRTRMATIASWFLMLSLQNRNTFILSGEDNLALVLLCWAVFLPLGARYSVDSALDKSAKTRPNFYFSIATAGLLLQGMSMYFFSALLKSDEQWMPDGTAVYYALQLDYLVTHFAIWFRQFETLLQGLTYYVYVLELVGPILIFSPILHRTLRIVIMIAFISMHLGFSLFLHIGLFPLISIIMNLTFLPGWVWDGLERRLASRKAESLTIWYNSDCDFCRKACHFLRTFLFLPEAKIRYARQDSEIHELQVQHRSSLVADGTSQSVKWHGVEKLVAASPVWRPLAPILALKPVRAAGNWAHDRITANRAALSRFSRSALPWKPVHVGPTETTNTLAGILLALVTFQNVSTLPAVALPHPYEYHQLRQFLGFYQYWTMFAPHPEMNSPWPVIEGRAANEQFVDVYNGTFGKPSFAKPDYVAGVYENYRWRKYLSTMEDFTYGNEPPRLAKIYAKYLCRVWNTGTANSEHLLHLTMHFQVEFTPPPGSAKTVERRTVYNHTCRGT